MLDPMIQQAAELEDAGELQQAADILRREALQGSVPGAFNLARLYFLMGFVEEAKELFGQIVARERHPEAMRSLGHCYLETAQLDTALRCFDGAGSFSEGLFYGLHADGNMTGAHESWARASVQQRLEGPRRHLCFSIKIMRVAYVGSGVIGTVKRFLDPVIANHTCQTGFFMEPTLEELNAFHPDVIVDLLGHMHRGKNLEVLAMAPCRVLCSYIGYPHWTGLDRMYRITDRVADPLNSLSERLIRIPSGCAWAYDSYDRLPICLPPSYKNGYLTFGSVNRTCKIIPEVAILWADILNLAPTARLIVLAKGGEENEAIRKMLCTYGVPADRLELTPESNRADFLEKINTKIDIALDTWPYNGMTTTCDLLAQGIPVITLAGKHHRSRVGASLLASVELDGLTAESRSEYLEIAVVMTKHLPSLVKLRHDIAQRFDRTIASNGAYIAHALETSWLSLL